MMKRKCYGCQTPVEAEGDVDEKLVLCDHCGDIMTGLSWANRVEFERLYEQQLAKANGVCDQSWSEYLQGEGR